MKYYLSLLLIVTSLFSYGQDYFIKSLNAIQYQHTFDQIEVLPNGNSVIAGGSLRISGSNSKVFIRMLNPCGEEVWSKEIVQTNTNIDFTDLHIDSNQNILLTARYSTTSTSVLPLIVKFDVKGNVLYSKQLTSSNGYNSLLHSSEVAPNGDYILLSLYRYSPSPPNVSTYSLSRLSQNGTLKWSKRYTGFFPWKWGVAGVGKDNGVLVNMSDLFFKTDSLGNLKWAKTYTGGFDNRKPIATDSGFIFTRYYLGGLDRGSAFSLGYDGTVKWSTFSYLNFFPYLGVLKRNGNLLLPGVNQLNGNSISFMELNSNTGNPISLKTFKDNTLNGIIPTNIAEDYDGNIHFVGHDNRGILKQTSIGKLTDSLSVVTCADSLVSPIPDLRGVSFVRDSAINAITVSDLSTTNFAANIVNVPLSSSFSSCSYRKNRGNHKLGNDTVLCGRQFILLGNSSTEFDSYLWNDSSTNKTNVATRTGTYWLEVVSACDTLRDTINVTYQPGILFSLGPDTVSCQDSLVLGAGLAKSLDYVWSTGATTDTIVVKNSGIYWVEFSNQCQTTRDSIEVNFIGNTPPIDLGKDTILCPKQQIVLGDLNSPYQTFLWSDSSIGKLLPVSQPGLYWLEAKDFCNVSRDSITVSFFPAIGLDLGPDQTLCNNQSIVLKSTNSHSNYLWSTGSTNCSINVNSVGIYWLEVQTNCGTVRDSIELDFEPNLIAPSLSSDTTLCMGETIELSTPLNQNFEWSTGETEKSIVVSKGKQWLTHFNKCDTLTDTISVNYYPKTFTNLIYNPLDILPLDSVQFINNGPLGFNPIWDFEDGVLSIGDTVFHQFRNAGSYKVSLSFIDSNNCVTSASTSVKVNLRPYFVPNIFSPNGNRVNDWFEPYGDDIKSFQIQIFNRWGKVVFNKNNIAWEGRDQSDNRLAAGTYKYVVSIVFTNENAKTLTGDITLVR